jgi:hypothetical protein
VGAREEAIVVSMDETEYANGFLVTVNAVIHDCGSKMMRFHVGLKTCIVRSPILTILPISLHDYYYFHYLNYRNYRKRPKFPRSFSFWAEAFS